MIDIKDIYSKLPRSWEELRLKDYQKLLTITPPKEELEGALKGSLGGFDYTIQVIHKLTGIPVDQLEEESFVNISVLATKLEFLLTFPERDKSYEINYKNFDEITYQHFVEFVKAQEKDIVDHVAMFRAVAKGKKNKKLTDQDILEMNMEELLQAFFLLRKDLKTYFRRSITTSRKKLMMFRLKKILPFKLRTRR